MKKSILMLTLTTALAGFVMLTGCSKDSPLSSSVNDDAVGIGNLDAEYGGYTTSDEAPSFGDAEIASEFGDDETVNDVVSLDPKVMDELESADSDVKVYFLRTTWGLLEGDSLATEVIDWSGYAETNKGTLVVLKKIRFEGNDYIHLPRTSRQRVDWTSLTKPHFDGIALAIIDNDTANAFVPGKLTISAGAYAQSFDFAELDSMDLLEPVGSLGHEISIVSRAREYAPFAGGFMEGRWLRKSDRGGVFRGRWINSMGTIAGHLRGHWGVNRRGNNVMFGKWIDMTGRFKGLLAGRWDTADDGEHGRFGGRYYGRSHDARGAFKGVWKAGRPDDRRGFFHGRWHDID